MGVGTVANGSSDSHALRTSERATQFIGRFQTAPRLRVVGDGCFDYEWEA